MRVAKGTQLRWEEEKERERERERESFIRNNSP